MWLLQCSRNHQLFGQKQPDESKRTPVPVSSEGVVVLLCGVGLVGGNGSAKNLPNLESCHGE